MSKTTQAKENSPADQTARAGAESGTGTKKTTAKRRAVKADNAASVSPVTKPVSTAKKKTAGVKAATVAARGEGETATKTKSPAKAKAKNASKTSATAKTSVKTAAAAKRKSAAAKDSRSAAVSAPLTLAEQAKVAGVSERFLQLVLKPGSLTIEEVNELGNFAPPGFDMAAHARAMRERNLAALDAYVHDVYENIKDYVPSRELTLFCGENGEINLCLRDRREVIYHNASPRAVCREQLDAAMERSVERVRFGGSVDPFGQIHMRYVNEVEKITLEKLADPLTARDLGEVPAVIVAGLGLGYIVEELLDRISCSLLVMIEPEKDLFLASLYCFDWKTLLERIGAMGCHGQLLVGQDPDTMYNNLQSHFMQHGRFLAGCTWCIVHYQSVAANQVVEKLRRSYGFMCDALGFYDDQLFGISHVCHAIKKGKAFIRNDADLPQSYLDLPFCLVGNGPSLDNDIAFLRKYQDAMIIVACGSALDTLYHAGIKPDFFAVTERTPDQAEFAELIPDKDFIDSLVLIASDVAHPDLLQHFKSTALFGKPDEAGLWMLRECSENGALIRPIGVMNPTVGNLGVATAVALKFKNVYMFGMDYGKPIGGKIHSSYSTLYERRDADEDRHYSFDETVKGNFGGKFELGGILKLGRHNVEEVIQIGKGQGTRFHNCSDGSEIRGATPLRSSVLAARLKKRLHTNLKRDALQFFRDQMLFNLDMDREAIVKMCGIEIFKELCAYLISLWDQEPAERKEYVRRMTLSIETLSGLNQPLSQKIPVFMGMLLRGTAESIFISIQYSLYGDADVKAAMERANRIARLWVYFLEDAQQLFTLLPDYILGDISRGLLKGKVGFDHPDSPAPDLPDLLPLTRKEFEDPQKKFVKRYK